MNPWYKIVTPRKEVREGRSFNPDEFAIALDQVVAGRGPDEERGPEVGASGKGRRFRGKRLGTKVIPKMKSGKDMKVVVDFSVEIDTLASRILKSDLKQLVQDLGLSGQLQLVKSNFRNE